MKLLGKRDLAFKLRLKRTPADKKADLMRDKFYHCGKNVKLYTNNFGTEPYLIYIGDNVVCASHVHFVNHDVSCFNIARFLELPDYYLDKVGSIILHDNCFVGTNTHLMPNCSVGKNSIIAAGSVVTKNVPDNEVWGGVPAKFIMTTKQYAEKVKDVASKYPWVDSNYCKKEMSEEDLIKARQNYFFKNLLNE